MDGGSRIAAKGLVVDDDELSAELLQVMLARLGVVAEIARDGFSGFQAFSQDHFSLVLVDRKLPDMDGLDLVRRMRVHSDSVRLLVVSGFGMDDDTARQSVGIDGFLMKPFSFEQFAQLIEPLLIH